MQLALIVSALLATAYGRYECTNATVREKNYASAVDFLFLIDASGSMQDKIDGVTAGLNQFAQSLISYNTSSRMAIVQFGGVPQVRLPFTASFSDFESAVRSVRANDAAANEAALEAIRASLPPFNGAQFGARCGSTYGGSDKNICRIQWRDGALKVIIVATDEDSDMPSMQQFRMPNQAAESFCQENYNADGSCRKPSRQWEPKFNPATFFRTSRDDYTYFRNGMPMSLEPSYEQEISETARAVLNSGAFVNVLVSKTVGTDNWSNMLPVSAFNSKSELWRQLKSSNAALPSDENTVTFYQMGSPLVAVQNADYTNFNANATLNALRANGMGNSLQARVLGGGSNMRVYDIDEFAAGNRNIINSFFTQLVRDSERIQQSCSFIPDPSSTDTGSQTSTTSTSTWTVNPTGGSSSSSVSTSATQTGGQQPQETEIDDGSENGGGRGGDNNETLKPTQDAPNTSGDNDNGNIPEIIGGIVGGVAALGAIIAGVTMYNSRVATPPAMVNSGSMGSLGGISENPLYASSGLRENPLYSSAGEMSRASSSDNLV